MIGVNTSIFKSAGRKLVNLLGALKDRATYYENGTDSVAEKNHIDDLGVLDKATILLTPTATSDARVHSVKTYTGDELVTNGGFYTDSDWVKQSNWTIANGSANSNGTGLLYQTSVPYVDGKTYKVTFDADITSGGGTVRLGNTSSSTAFTNGSNVFYLQTDASNTTRYIFFQGNSFIGSIDNVSVIDVSSDFAFDRASSATRINSDGLVQDMQSITDPELVLNGDFEELGDDVLVGNNSTFDSGIGDWLTYTNGIIAHDTDKLEVTLVSGGGARINTSSLFTGGQAGKTLKIRARIWQGTTTRSNIAVYVGSVQETVSISSTPTYFEVYLKPTSTGYLTIYTSSGNGTFFIDDISVKEVDPNDRWNAGNKWSISGGTANKATDATSNISQTIDGISGKLQKVVFTVSNYGGSGGVGASADGSNYTENEGNGTFTEYITPNSNNLYIRASYSFVGSIDNVSVKEATFSDDVDLARINYDSNGENGHILLEPTSTNLVTYSEDIDSLDDGDGEVGVNSTLTYESDVVAPDGSLGVYRIQNPATASTYLKVTNNTTAAQSMSVWVKAKTVGTNNQFTLYRDGTGSLASDVKTATGEWQRFEYSWSAVGSGAYFINNDGDTYTSDLYVWGFQVENLPYSTSYIPNHGTDVGVTRATETLTGSGNSTLINSTEGVLYAEIATLSEDNNVAFKSLSIAFNSTNKVMITTQSTSLTSVNIRRSDDASNKFVNILTSSESVNFNKIAILYKSGENKIFVNGSRITDTAFDTFTFDYVGNSKSFNKLEFANGSGASNFQGKVKALAVFNEALSDDELELLTGVTNYGSFGELASANGYTII